MSLRDPWVTLRLRGWDCMAGEFPVVSHRMLASRAELEALRASGAHFEDPAFPAAAASLGCPRLE